HLAIVDVAREPELRRHLVDDLLTARTECHDPSQVTLHKYAHRKSRHLAHADNADSNLVHDGFFSFLLIIAAHSAMRVQFTIRAAAAGSYSAGSFLCRRRRSSQ